MHWALRLPQSSPDSFPKSINRKYSKQLERMHALVDKIHAGQYRGCDGEVIQDVVNIVGGSTRATSMVTHALGSTLRSQLQTFGRTFCFDYGW